MSIEVTPDALAEIVEGFPVAYLLTLGDRPRPHVDAVDATVADGVVRLWNVGRTGLHDVARHDAVTLLLAPSEPGGYSLILDGTATVVDERLDVVPQRAVLHRPAPPARSSESPCASDCVELPVVLPVDS